MADPKYANLPGIAHDEPDVYETIDLPESDQTPDFFEENDEIIGLINISATDAYKKFKGKSVNAANVDFSDRISKHVRTGYEVNYELVEQGEKETIIQKSHRLQCELKELAEELKCLTDKEDSNAEVTTEQVDQALRKLADLKIEDTLGKDLISAINDPQGSQIKKLLSQLETFKASAAEIPESQQGENSDGVKFVLNYKPEHVKLVQTARVADLEKRLHRLETALGTKTDQLARLTSATNKNSLLEVAQHLSATASLLDSSQLDHIEGRLTALAQKMDAIVKKKEELEVDENKDKMILELYELVKGSESIHKVLPKTVERLQALEALHNKAANFTATLTQVETLQTEIKEAVQNNKVLLKGVQESFANNLNEISQTAISLDSRIKALKKN